MSNTEKSRPPRVLNISYLRRWCPATIIDRVPSHPLRRALLRTRASVCRRSRQFSFRHVRLYMARTRTTTTIFFDSLFSRARETIAFHTRSFFVFGLRRGRHTRFPRRSARDSLGARTNDGGRTFNRIARTKRRRAFGSKVFFPSAYIGYGVGERFPSFWSFLVVDQH